MFLLIALAVAGASLQGARATTIAPPMPCTMTITDAAPGEAVPPCKGITSDCVKKMGCIGDTGLPARPAATMGTSRLHEVGYWVGRSSLRGLVHQPEPLPPRMI